MRSIPFYPLMVLLLIGLGGYLGCDPNSLQPPLGNLPEETASGNPQYRASIPDRSPSSILVGSFNMQRLGPSKLGDPWVMDKFAEIIRRFDVIALQEITSKDQQTVPALVQHVNRTGGRYAFTISPRLGRAASGYYEQYAFLYDTTRIQSGPDYCYTVSDDQDFLHREPFVGRFLVASPTGQPFAFTLINMHTDPDVDQELDVLADVYVNVRQYEYPEDDVLLLGDLNAEPGKLRRLGQIPGISAVIQDVPTNIRGNRTIDNILADVHSTREFTGRAGTIDLKTMFSIDQSEAERISDHLPIWAEFTATEQAFSQATSVSVPASAAVR